MEIVVLYLVRGFAAVRWFFLLILVGITFVLTPIIMFLALPFLRQSVDNVLPKSLQFLNTYDDLGMNQGMYEPQVKWMYNHFGWYVKTYYWLGIRNQCYTLFNWLAPTPGVRAVIMTPNWRILYTPGGYFCFLNRHRDIGFGWKLFNAGKTSFYFRPRFWKEPSN
jgi:hypothetical protein